MAPRADWLTDYNPNEHKRENTDPPPDPMSRPIRALDNFLRRARIRVIRVRRLLNRVLDPPGGWR